MLSKSNLQSLLFLAVAVGITLLFLTGQVGGVLSGAGLPAYKADLFAFLAIVSVAVVSLAFGGNKTMIMIGGTVTAFIVLTAFQDSMVRYMTLGAIFFAIGAYGMVASRNAVRMLMSIELMINAANINFVTFSRAVDPEHLGGQLFAIFVLTVAAAEAAVGLAIVLAIYRNMATVDMEKFNLLKW